jgi:hypothetical protein
MRFKKLMSSLIKENGEVETKEEAKKEEMQEIED